MVNLLPEPYDKMFMTFFFVYVRVSTAIFVTPVLNNQMVSRSVRAGIAFWIAMVLMGPALGLHQSVDGFMLPFTDHVYNGIVAFALAVGCEILIGFMLGFIAEMLLQTVGLAGEIIGQQSGFSAASVFDPITGQDIFLIAQINTMLGTMLFLAIHGPETVLSMLADSFYILRPGEGFALATYSDVAYHSILYHGAADRGFALTSILYKMGIQIAAPMIGAMMLISIAEAFIARTVPQLNIMVVGFAIRISLSLIILLSFMPFFATAFTRHLMKFTTYAQAFMVNMVTP